MKELPRVKDVMNSRTFAVRAQDNVHDVVETFMDERITGVPVIDDAGTVIGMLTERECLRLLSHPGEGLETVGQLMTTDIVTVTPDMDVPFVAGVFNKHPNIRRFAVVSDKDLVGVVTRKDILRAIRQMDPS